MNMCKEYEDDQYVDMFLNKNMSTVKDIVEEAVVEFFLGRKSSVGLDAEVMKCEINVKNWETECVIKVNEEGEPGKSWNHEESFDLRDLDLPKARMFLDVVKGKAPSGLL